MMQKDMLLAIELGRQFDVPLPTTAARMKSSRQLAPWAWRSRILPAVRCIGIHVGSDHTADCERQKVNVANILGQNAKSGMKF